MKLKIIGEIGLDVTAEEFNAKLETATGDITIHLDSPGGSVFDGVSIFNAIRNYTKGEVTIIIDSICASIASYIAMAGDTISVHDNSALMIHNAHTGSRGDARSFEDTAKTLRGVNDVMAQAYHQKSGLGKEKIQNFMDHETYFFGEDIVSHGFADKMIATGLEATVEQLSTLASKRVTDCNENCKNRPMDNMAALATILYKDVKLNPLAIEAKKMMEEIS